MALTEPTTAATLTFPPALPVLVTSPVLSMVTMLDGEALKIAWLVRSTV